MLSYQVTCIMVLLFFTGYSLIAQSNAVFMVIVLLMGSAFVMLGGRVQTVTFKPVLQNVSMVFAVMPQDCVSVILDFLVRPFFNIIIFFRDNYCMYHCVLTLIGSTLCH